MMMMGPDKKKTVSIIVDSLARKDAGLDSSMGGDKGKDGEDDMAVGKEAAAEKMMSALADKDATAFAAALEDFVAMCYDDPMTIDESDDKDDKYDEDL